MDTEVSIRTEYVGFTHKVPSILTPCRCAALIHPEGGTATLWCEKLHDLIDVSFS